MRKRIVTHPDNLEYVHKIFAEKDEQERDRESDFCHFIKPFWLSGIEFVTNRLMDKEKWTGRWLTQQNKFYTYWDGVGEPPSWAIYFGFVKKEMEPLFYEMSDFSMVFRDCLYPKVKENRSLILNAIS